LHFRNLAKESHRAGKDKLRPLRAISKLNVLLANQFQP
jgi:hypothetical protein